MVHRRAVARESVMASLNNSAPHVAAASLNSSAAAAASKNRLLEANMLAGSWTRVAAASESDLTLKKLLVSELEYELHSVSGAGKSKLVLAIIEMIGLGIFGVDRCYMGQALLGVAKGLTFGGFMVWALLDYALVVTTMLGRYDGIHGLGYNVEFDRVESVESFWAVVVMRCFMFAMVILWFLRSRRAKPTNERRPLVDFGSRSSR